MGATGTSVGRPTKYVAETLKTAQAYIQQCKKEGRMPFVEELALELGVNDDTIVEWAGKHEEFSATVKRLKLLQKLHLKRDALERKIHPTMSIFLLKANHGLNEKEPDVEKGQDNIVVTFYDTHRVLKEINELLEKENVGRIEGKTGEFAYVSAKGLPSKALSKMYDETGNKTHD